MVVLSDPISAAVNRTFFAVDPPLFFSFTTAVIVSLDRESEYVTESWGGVGGGCAEVTLIRTLAAAVV